MLVNCFMHTGTFTSSLAKAVTCRCAVLLLLAAAAVSCYSESTNDYGARECQETLAPLVQRCSTPRDAAAAEVPRLLRLGALSCLLSQGNELDMELRICAPNQSSELIYAESAGLLSSALPPSANTGLLLAFRPRVAGCDDLYNASWWWNITAEWQRVGAMTNVQAAAPVAGLGGPPGVLLAPAYIMEQAGWAGQLLNLMPLMQLDRRLDHTDILLPLRHHVSLDPYAGSTALPLDGSMLVMVYRQDVLEATNQQVPQTWDELVNFVDRYDSVRPPWAPPAALCTTPGAACDGSELFNAIWYSIAQSAGVTQGVHFDPATMQPRANTAALRAAARLFAQLQRRAVAQPGAACLPVHPGLRGGGCAIAVGTLEQVKDVAYEGQHRDDGSADGPRARGAQASAYSVSQLPGSPYVQDPRNSSNLLPCTHDTCPLADTAMLQRSPSSTAAEVLAALGLSNWPTREGAAGPTAVESRRRNLLGGARRGCNSAERVGDGTCMQLPRRTHLRGLQQVQERAAAGGSPNGVGSGGGDYLVNRVPFVLQSTLAGGVRKGMPPEQQLLAYYALALLADPQTSLRLVVAPGSNLMPSRASHFSTAARETWATAGYDRRLVGEALDVLWAAWGSTNLGWGLRMAGGRYYEAALSVFMQRVVPRPGSPLPSAAELAAAAESLQQQVAAHYSPASDYAVLYSVFLHGPSGWSRIPQTVAPEPAAQQLGQRAGSAPGSGSRLAGRTNALVVAVVVAFAALLAAVGYVGVNRRWRPCRGLKPKSRLSWRSDAPGAGPSTTLLVTDIEGSTTLWEALDADVMGRALSLHHACLRRVLVRHRGYESATEGDSFILAFHTPGSALEFALEAQQALLEQEWPEALLAEPMCAAVYTNMPAGFPFKRPQALDAALAGLHLAQRSNVPAGSTPSTPKVFHSSTLARFTSFRNRRLSLSHSPGPAPRSRRHRASIDLGALPAADGAAFASGVMLTGLEGMSAAAPRWHAYPASVGDPVALPSCAASLGPTHSGRTLLQLRSATGNCGALPLVDSPLPQLRPGRDDSRPPAKHHGDWRDGQEPRAPGLLWVSGVQGGTTPRGEQGEGGLGVSSRPAALPCTPRSQGELARRLQEQQEYLKQQLQLEPQPDTAESRISLEEPAAGALRVCPLSPMLPATASTTPRDGQVSPVGTIGTASTGSGWAVIHGAEAAQVLQGESPVARYLLGSTLAAIESAECDSAAVSVPTLIQQRAVAEATSCLAAATDGGVVSAATGDHAADKQPGHESGSASLPVLGLSCRPGRSDTRGGGTPKRVGTWHSAAAASSPTVWASGLTATGGAAAGGTAAAWVVCTLESAFRAAVQAFDSDAAGPVPDRKRHLAFCGLRVRMGLHSGICKASDVADNRASARTVYSGDCAGVVRCVSDCAQGGMVLLSDTCIEALDAAAGGGGGVTVGGGAEAFLVGLGRYKVKYRDKQVGLYLATSGELAPRVALLPPPRSVSPIGLSLYHAPIGRAAVAAVQVQDLHVLQEWDAGTTAQALAMLWNVLVEQLAGHRGYLVRKDPDGQLLAVFAFPLDAVRWALTCRTILTSAVDWPPTLLAHDLCREAVAGRVSHGGYLGGLWGMRGAATSYTSASRNWMAKHLQGASGHLTPHGAVLPKASLELEASPSPLCDTGRTWISSLVAGKSSGRQERVSTDGDRGGILRGDTCTSVAGSTYRMPYSCTSADLDSAAPNALAKSGTGGLAGCSKGSRRRGMRTLAQAPNSGAASEGVPDGTLPAFGSSSNTPASKHTAGNGPGHCGWASKWGASGCLARARVSTGGMAEAQRVPTSTTVPSMWLQANPLPDPESRTSGSGAYAAMAAAYSSEGGPVSPRPGNIALPAALNLAGASQSTVATAGTVVTPAQAAGAPSHGGASVGSNLPHSHLTVRTSLDWAGTPSDRLGSEAEDGGDVFTAHVGTIEGLGPFGQPPRCSLSGGGPLYSTGATNAGMGCGSEREGEEVQVLRGLRLCVGIDCGHLDWSISSATHSLSYVGGPVLGAERLAQSAGAGQVLASFDVMAQVHTMQSSVYAQHQEDPGGAARAAAAAGSGFQATVGGVGGGAGGGGGGALGPAVAGLPLKVSRARMGSRSRRLLVFACRYTPDWDEALREWELCAGAPGVPGTPSSAHSPKSSLRLSPFTSPWSWSAAAAARWTRRRATAGGAVPLDARSPDTARTESRCSMDALPSGLRTGNCTPLTHALATASSSVRHLSLQGYSTPPSTKSGAVLQPRSLAASRKSGFPTGAHSARGTQPSRALSSAASSARPSLDPPSGFGYCVGGTVLPAGSIPGLRPGSTSGAGPLAARLGTAASLPQVPFPSPSTALLPGVRSSRPTIGSASPAQGCSNNVQHAPSAVGRDSGFTSGSLTLRVMRNSMSTSCNVSSKAMAAAAAAVSPDAHSVALLARFPSGGSVGGPWGYGAVPARHETGVGGVLGLSAVAEAGGMEGGDKAQADAREREVTGGMWGLQMQQQPRQSSLGSSGGCGARRDVGAGLALGLAPSPLQQALRQHRVQQRAQEQHLQLQQQLQQYVHTAQQLQQPPQSGGSSPSTGAPILPPPAQAAAAAAGAVGQPSPGSAPHQEPTWPKGHGPTPQLCAGPGSWRASLSLDSCDAEVSIDHQDGSTPSAHAPVGSASPLGNRLRTSIEGGGRGGSGPQLHPREDSPVATPEAEWSTSVSAAAQRSYGGNGGGGAGAAPAGQPQAWGAAGGDDDVAVTEATHAGAAPALLPSWASPWLDKAPVSPRPAAAAGQDGTQRAEEEGIMCGGSPTAGMGATFGAVWAESLGMTTSRCQGMNPSCLGAGMEGAGGVQGGMAGAGGVQSGGADRHSGRCSREQLQQAQQSSGGFAGASSAKVSPRRRLPASPSRLSSFVADGLEDFGNILECISRATVHATISSEGITAAAAAAAVAAAAAAEAAAHQGSGSRGASVTHSAAAHGPHGDAAGCAASAALDAGSSANAWDMRGPASSLLRPGAAAGAAAAAGEGNATPAGAFSADYALNCLGGRPLQPTPAMGAVPSVPDAEAAPAGRCEGSWLERWLEGQAPRSQRPPCIDRPPNAVRHSASFPRNHPHLSTAPAQPSAAAAARRASNGSLPGARADAVDALDQPYLDDTLYDSRTTVRAPYGWRSGVHPPGSSGLAAASLGGRGSNIVGRAGSSVAGGSAAADGRSSLVSPAAATLSLALPRSSVSSSGGGGGGGKEAATPAGGQGSTERLWKGIGRMCALSLDRQSAGVVVGWGVEETEEEV